MLLVWGVVATEALLKEFHKSGSFKEKTKTFGCTPPLIIRINNRCPQYLNMCTLGEFTSTHTGFIVKLYKPQLVFWLLLDIIKS
jgi:hypothetical protein